MSRLFPTSTCLGRLPTAAAVRDANEGERKFGVTHLRAPPPGFLAAHRRRLWVSPNGIVFATPALRKGVLPRMMFEARVRAMQGRGGGREMMARA